MKRRKIAESVISGRKPGGEMTLFYDVSQPPVSRMSFDIAPIIPSA